MDARSCAPPGNGSLRGHIVSGGSTLTMQVARLIEPRPERTLPAKLRQIARAAEIERAVGKAGVLDRYLTLAPFGGNLEGVRAAALAYFGKEPLKLTIAEAALLVALPQSPEARRPDRFPATARAARDRVLDRAAERSAISREEAAAREGRPGSGDAQSLSGARGARRRGGRRCRPQGEAHPALDRRAPAGQARGAGQRKRRAVGPQVVGGDGGRRQP